MNNIHQQIIRTMVRTAYDMQKLRIQMGNRITQNFKVKLGLTESSMSEKELEKEEKAILQRLRLAYTRITDGVVTEGSDIVEKKKLPTERKFVGEGLITEYGELLLMDNYMRLLQTEEKHFREMEKTLNKIPIYTEFLKDVRGVGPAMAAVVISEINIHNTKYPSSLHAYCGLDTVTYGRYTVNGQNKIVRADEVSQYLSDPANEGKPMIINGQVVEFITEGRSKKEQSLVERTYVDRDGTERTRMSITHNPFLKTKLIGVLGTSFLRSGTSTVDGVKMGGARRLELAKEKGFKPESFEADEIEEKVIDFLRMSGHDVHVEASKYGKVYNDYKNRLANHVNHKTKSVLHRHNMAIRYMIKIFLTDLYAKWRALEGLEVSEPYEVAKLGYKHGSK